MREVNRIGVRAAAALVDTSGKTARVSCLSAAFAGESKAERTTATAAARTERFRIEVRDMVTLLLGRLGMSNSMDVIVLIRLRR
jgi:hypothetical protein